MEKYSQNKSKEREAYGEPEPVQKGPLIGKRHVQAIVLFLCVSIEMMTRSSLSLSIVAMTDNTTSVNPDVPTYNWTDKNIVLSSFYWGYIVLQVVAGQLSKDYGAKWLLLVAMGVNSVALALVPLAAQYGGSQGVMVCRILQGVFQGLIFPSCHTMLGRWAPKEERSRMSTFVFSGIPIGTIVCLPITGVLCKSYLGWPVSCYLFGGCGLAWCFLWFYTGYNNPTLHPSITSEEKNYIELSLSQKDGEAVLPTPWKEIVTSIPCWACLISTVGAGFGVIFLQNEIPTYLEKVMKYDVTASGNLTSMTAAVAFVFAYVYGPLADYVVEKNYLSRTNIRKLCAVYSMWGSAITMLILAYLDESQAHLSVFILAVSSVFIAALLFGHGVNPMDLSPRFSGIILGWSNSTSCVVALAAPLAVQYIVLDETNPTQWRIVFIVAAVMYMVPSAIFAIFASGERQWWDDGGAKFQRNVVADQDEYERKISTA